MNKKSFLPFCILPIVFFISYLLTDQLLLSFIILFYVVWIIYLILKEKKRDETKLLQIENAYTFSNFLSMQMYSSTNLFEAYQMIEPYIAQSFQNLNGEYFLEEINQIADEYALNGFSLYVKTMILYHNNGGDFTKMQISATNICQKTKIYYFKLKEKKKYKIYEISILYFLWIFVMLFIKFALSNYFTQMLSFSLFQILLGIILIIGLHFFYETIRIYYKNNIKGL